MTRKFILTMIVCFCGVFFAAAQSNTAGTGDVKEANLRPISRDYVPVRRGNNFERVTRTRIPVARLNGQRAKQDNTIKKNAQKRRDKASKIRKARIDKARMRRSM